MYIKLDTLYSFKTETQSSYALHASAATKRHFGFSISAEWLPHQASNIRLVMSPAERSPQQLPAVRRV